MARLVALNEKGVRIGEDHQNATLTDCEVDAIRELHEQGLSYNTLAEKFDVSKSTIAMICRLERRACTAKRWKTLPAVAAPKPTVSRLLSQADRQRIRELHAEGMSFYCLAEHFKVSKSYVAKICSSNQAQVTATHAHTNQQTGEHIERI